MQNTNISSNFPDLSKFNNTENDKIDWLNDLKAVIDNEIKSQSVQLDDEI